MIKLHWTVWCIIIVCVLGMIGLTVASMFLSKPIPEGGLALLASVASGLIGYEAGQKERGNNE